MCEIVIYVFIFEEQFFVGAFLQIADKKGFLANDTLMTNLFGLDTLPSLM